MRNGRSTRLRRKDPDPRIGDHLPPPTKPRPVGDAGQGDEQQEACSSVSPHSSPGAKSDGDIAVSIVSTQANTFDVKHVSPGRRSAEPAPMSSPFSGEAGLLMATQGNVGRLSTVIDRMRLLSTHQEGRVLNLRDAATNVSTAHGDSLDILLQEFAGCGARSPTGRVDLGRPASLVTSNQFERGTSLQADAFPLLRGAETKMPLVPPRRTLADAIIERGDAQGGGAVPDFSSTMIHTTEVVLPSQRFVARNRHTRRVDDLSADHSM